VVVIARPRSAAAEQYRVLARKLERRIGAGARRIAVTSSVAGEGRTTTAVNLALALGAGGRQRVALVDANLRERPDGLAVHTLLGLGAQAGLADVVRSRAPIDETLERSLWRFRDDDTYVLPAGRTDAPHEIAASRRLGEALRALRDRFDVVIIDAPPVLPTADMLALAGEVDGALLVVRAGRTPRDVVQLALRTLSSLGEGVPLLGCVLNEVEAGAGAPFRLYAKHDREVRGLLPAVAASTTAGAHG
jgi:non-specific protein-tyrosine kinase